MNAWLLAAGGVSALLALGHSTGGHRFVFRPMSEAHFDPIARRTMVFVWHFSTLVLWMTAFGLLGAALVPHGDTLATYLLVQSLGLAVIHLVTAATSKIAKWPVVMPQWSVFGVIAGLIAAGVADG